MRPPVYPKAPVTTPIAVAPSQRLVLAHSFWGRGTSAHLGGDGNPHPTSRTPRDGGASAVRPKSAPNTASEGHRPRPCVGARAAVRPDAATTTSFTISVVRGGLDQSGRMARMFQTPVATGRANADQAIALNRRATARGASGETRRRPGNEAGQRQLAPHPHGCPQHVRGEFGRSSR